MEDDTTMKVKGKEGAWGSWGWWGSWGIDGEISNDSIEKGRRLWLLDLVQQIYLHCPHQQTLVEDHVSEDHVWNDDWLISTILRAIPEFVMTESTLHRKVLYMHPLELTCILQDHPPYERDTYTYTHLGMYLGSCWPRTIKQRHIIPSGIILEEHPKLLFLVLFSSSPILFVYQLPSIMLYCHVGFSIIPCTKWQRKDIYLFIPIALTIGEFLIYVP